MGGLRLRLRIGSRRAAGGSSIFHPPSAILGVLAPIGTVVSELRDLVQYFSRDDYRNAILIEPYDFSDTSKLLDRLDLASSTAAISAKHSMIGYFGSECFRVFE